MADEFGVPDRSTTYLDTADDAAPVIASSGATAASYQPVSSAPAGSDSSGSTTDVAKEQAAAVGQNAADAGKHVAGTAKDQATAVAGEAADQAKNLYHQTREELQGQAATQQDRLATGIRSLSDELAGMADRGNAGTASDLVREVSGRAGDIAGWLEQRDPGALLQEVTDFARRRPGAFLAIAAGAGLVAGRLTRGAVSAAHKDTDSDTNTAAASRPTASTRTGTAGYEPAPYEPVAGYESVPGYEATPYEETAATRRTTGTAPFTNGRSGL